MAGATRGRLANVMKARWAAAPTKRHDHILEKFDRGEDVFEFCDMSAGAMKVPLD
jgi:hypothetical protein